MVGALPIMQQQPVAHAIFLLAAVAVAGLALGAIKYRGVGLGTAGVIFAGTGIGRFGQRVDHATLDFVKEFGLVLFVFTIGMQLGPGFLAALREQGLRLNLIGGGSVGGGWGGGARSGRWPVRRCAGSTTPPPWASSPAPRPIRPLSARPSRRSRHCPASPQTAPLCRRWRTPSPTPPASAASSARSWR